MIKTLIASIVLLPALSSPRLYLGQNDPARSSHVVPAQTINWKIYTSLDKYDFSIKYPTDFSLETKLHGADVCFEQTRVACLFYAGKSYAGTNLRSAGVSINIDPSLNTQEKCYSFQNASFEINKPAGDVTIHGVTFKSVTGNEGAMGRSDEVQVYRNFHNNMCYELEQRVASSNIGFYDPGTIKQFNRDRIWRRLNAVVRTFAFVK